MEPYSSDNSVTRGSTGSRRRSTISQHPVASLCILLLLVAALAVSGCGRNAAPAQDGPLLFVATVQPLHDILRELTRDRAEVVLLLPGSASPHTYEPKPSDARAAASARALFYVSPELDGWATQLQVKERIAVLPMLPDGALLELAEHHHEGHAHEHHSHDPHFWTDPHMVRELLPALVAELARLDAPGREQYAANAEAFSRQLRELDQRLAEELEPLKGRKVILFHPSFQYLLRRYGLEYAGAVELFPGREPGPAYLQQLVERLRKEKIKALFTEPQLPAAPAEVIGREAKVPVYTLDPYGIREEEGEPYGAYLLRNARTLREALQ